jgi:hypothetical protein
MPMPAALPQHGRTTLQRLSTRRGPAAGSRLARRRFRTARLAGRAGQLAPRTFPRILDAACDALAARFTPCFCVSLLLWFPAVFAQALLVRNAPDWAVLGWSASVPNLVQGLTVVFVCSLVGAYLEGREVAVREELLHGFARAPGGVVLGLVTGVASATGLCFCFVPGVALYWLFAAAPAVYVLERTSVFRAVGRSVTLAANGGAFLRWAGCTAIGKLMAGPFVWTKDVLDMVPVRNALEEHLALSGHSFDLAVAALAAPLLAIGTAFAAVVRTVYYIDLRTRREGLDLELRLAALRAGAPAAVPEEEEGA